MPTSPQFSVSVKLFALDAVSSVLGGIAKNVYRTSREIKEQSKSLSEFQEKIGKKTKIHSLSDSTEALKKSMSVFSDVSGIRGFFSHLERGAVHAESAVSNLRSAMRSTFGLITGSGLAIGGMGYLSMKSFQSMSENHLNWIRESKQIGISPEGLRGLQYASQSMGAGKENIAQALSHLNQVAFQVAAGNTGAGLPFFALKGGFSFRDAKSGNIKASDEMLMEVFKKLKAIQSPQIRAQMATQTLGDTALLPLIDKGVPKLQKLRDEYKLIHLAMNKSGLDLATLNAEKYLASTAKLKVSLEELHTVAGAQFLPGFTEMLNRITTWINQNSNSIGIFFEKLGNQLPTELERLTDSLKPIGEAILFLSEKVGVLRLAVTALAGSVLISLTKSLFASVMGLAQVFSGVLSLGGLLPFLATPVGAAVGVGALGVTAVAGAGAYLGYQNLIKNSDLNKQKGEDRKNEPLPWQESETKEKKDNAFQSLLLKEVSQARSDTVVKIDPKTFSSASKGEITLKFVDAPSQLKILQNQGDYHFNLGSLQVGQ
jgi:uncharacterized membrane protein YebE (DUF533 family)